MRPRHWLLTGSLVAASILIGAHPAHAGCSSHWNNRYHGFVARIHDPASRSSYGTCHDYGSWFGSSYKGRRVPRGAYWVYVYPNWYVWRHRRSAQYLRPRCTGAPC